MDQELEAGANSSPRLITTKTWVILINFIHPSPMPVTTDFVEYMFDVCMLYSLLPSIPYTAALLLHHLHGISPLEGWAGQQLFLVAIIIMVKFLCKDPPLPRNGWWSIGLFEVKEFNHMEAGFCQCLDWHVAISGPELESFLAFSQWFMEKAAFHSSPSLSQTLLKPQWRSRVVNHSALGSLVSMLETNGSG